MKNLFILIALISISSSLFSQTAVTPEVGDGSENNPYHIASLENLYWIAENPIRWNLHYIQVSDIDATETSNWFAGQGWSTIGTSTTRFQGSYNGDYHVIDGLYIYRPESHHQGLFGYSYGAQIRNLGLTNFDITGYSNVGSLAGTGNNTIIFNCYSTGTVTGNHTALGGLIGYNLQSNTASCYFDGIVNGDYSVGGLVGEMQTSSVSFSYSSGIISGINNRIGGLIGHAWDDSEVSDSYSIADISGNNQIGGFIGYFSESSLNNCFSSGYVNGNQEIGGLVGTSGESTISNSYSISWVNGVGNMVGGLVGYNSSLALIINCHSTGSVSGGANNVGGLVGNNGWSSSITNCYSTGDVTGTNQRVGGLVGNHNMTSIINNSYSTGNVTGIDRVGGLVGQNYQSIIINSFSKGFITGNTNVGGFSGLIDTGGSFQEINNYWNIETSGQTSSAGGYGRTTEEMTYPYAVNTYVDWDFMEIWQEDQEYSTNDGYPFLLWQIIEEDPLPPAAAYNPIPEDGATDIPVNTPIGWTYTSIPGFSDPEGFEINLWIGDHSGDPYQAYVVGGPGEYLFTELPFVFSYQENYYWQVIPYIIFNDTYILAEECPVWSFTTEQDVSVDIVNNDIKTVLQANYPNPFNPETNIKYNLSEDTARLDLKIYNIKGQVVRILHSGSHLKGNYEVFWDGKSDNGSYVSSGIYYYQMITHDFNKVRKMILLK